ATLSGIPLWKSSKPPPLLSLFTYFHIKSMNLNPTYYLACDLGLERGRLLLGTLNRAQLTLQEIATFPIRATNGSGPDLAELEKQIFAAIAKAATLDLPISGLSATSWD